MAAQCHVDIREPWLFVCLFKNNVFSHESWDLHLAKASVIMADAALLCACLDCFSEGASPFVLTIDFERLHRADYIQGGYNMQLGSEVGRASLSDFVDCAQVPPHRHDRSLPRLKPGACSHSWNPKQPVRFTRVLLGDWQRFGPLAGWRASSGAETAAMSKPYLAALCALPLGRL